MAKEQLSKADTAQKSDSSEAFVDTTFTSSEEWSEWLAEQQRVALEVYSIKPGQLIADQRREQGISRDYEGREILELLQNATDAAKKTGQRGRIRVELLSQGLIVANTGLGFTTGGVQSLQTADLSPKRGRNSQLIGSKGLGFRSVLNWTRHPIIISGSLNIGFSGRYAEGLVEELSQQYSAVRSELEKYQVEGSGLAPLLPFPVDLSVIDQANVVENTALFERCQQLRVDGYQTIIGMPFDREHSYENALNQLKQLRSEFLLFSDAIELLSISVVPKSEGEGWEKQWSSTIVSDGVVDLLECDISNAKEFSQRWQLFSRSGDIPAELLRDYDDPERYHLVVAVPEKGLVEPANLYSFFPTSIPLPIHMLCHASLELEQNRKHLQEGEANKFVLQDLAAFVAEIVEQQAAKSGNTYQALDLLNPDSLIKEYQADIKPFQDALIDAIKVRCILPALSGKLLSANKVQFFPGGKSNANWLPASIFPSVIQARTPEESSLFEKLDVGKITADQFISSIEAADSISIAQRAAIILGIIDRNLDTEFCYKGLLLDSTGNELSEEDRVFQPGTNLSSDLNFPDWANIKILNTELWRLLRRKNLRESVQMLADFDVREYSLANTVNTVIASANRIIEEGSEEFVRESLLQTLYKLYGLFSSEDERPSISKSNVLMLSRTGDWRSANKLYYGAGYSAEGNILEGLYAALPEKFLAPKNAFKALDIAEKDWVGFFDWLGVASWPRLVDQRKVEADFLTFVKPRLKYPAIFIEGNYKYETPEQLPPDCKITRVKSLDELDAILFSHSDAILAWLATDPRIPGWLRDSNGHGELNFWPYKKKNARSFQGNLPSYIHWKIKHTPWLASHSGSKQAPVDCMVNDAAVSGLFPQPVFPSPEAMEALGLTPVLLKHAWLNAGIKADIEDLGSEEVYSLLLDLPEKDPSGTLAKKLYNWLIKTRPSDFEPDETGENYLSFVARGKIYAKKGDAYGYYPVADAYHIDVEGFPQELVRSLAVASLLKKRGAEKVRRLFGVNVLDKKAVNEKVIDYRSAACTVLANQHFQTAKKYIEIYRHSQFSKAPGRVLFEQLELVVCEHVQSQITFNEETLDNFLPPWNYSIQGKRLFVSTNSEYARDPCNALLSNTVGEAVASIFGLAEGDSFSKIYQCNESSRVELLSKMLGDELDDNLESMLQRLIEEAAVSEVATPTVTMGVIPKPASLVTPKTQLSELIPTPVDNESETASTAWNVPSYIGVESTEHTPKAPGSRVKKRVSSGVGRKASTSGKTISISDGRAGEKLAELFEQQEGRFPLAIGKITGYETIVADILSFQSAEDREEFASNRNQNASLVVRVIEAKEKTSGGNVSLSVNEVNTAAVWKEKYYIYRFTPSDVEAAEYQLTTLNNPLSQLEAVSSSIEISLDIAATSKQYRVFGKENND